jgi:hypothetical protein
MRDYQKGEDHYQASLPRAEQLQRRLKFIALIATQYRERVCENRSRDRGKKSR